MTTETKCPVCKQPWPNANATDRVRAHRGSRTMTQAAAEAHVGRITYGRIEAGVSTSWPDFLAVMSAAGISLEETRAAHATAKRQKGNSPEIPDSSAECAIKGHDRTTQHEPAHTGLHNVYDSRCKPGQHTIVAGSCSVCGVDATPAQHFDSAPTPMSGLVRALTPPVDPDDQLITDEEFRSIHNPEKTAALKRATEKIPIAPELNHAPDALPAKPKRHGFDGAIITATAREIAAREKAKKALQEQAPSS